MLTIDGEVIETTPEHPFYEIAEWMAWEQVDVIQPGVWTDAEDLQIGDKVTRANGLLGTVVSVQFVHTTQRMYNFTVATAHTYFVGDNNLLVHNCGYVLKPDTLARNRHEWVGTNMDVDASMQHHWQEHGYGWDSFDEYTQDARNHWNQHRDRAYETTLADGSTGYKITYKGYFGIYTPEGQIVTFGVVDGY